VSQVSPPLKSEKKQGRRAVTRKREGRAGADKAPLKEVAGSIKEAAQKGKKEVRIKKTSSKKNGPAEKPRTNAGRLQERKKDRKRDSRGEGSLKRGGEVPAGVVGGPSKRGEVTPRTSMKREGGETREEKIEKPQREYMI